MVHPRLEFGEEGEEGRVVFQGYDPTLIPPSPTLTPPEMRDRPGPQLAPRPLLLRSMWKHVRRGRLPREGREGLLPGGLLQHVRPQVRGLQRPHHGELHISSQRPVASGLLCVQGE